MFTGSKETGVYIVDNHYNIIYYNNTAKETFSLMAIGGQCFAILNDEQAPCPYCPFNEKSSSRTLLFCTKIGKWLDLSSSIIEWPKAGTCNLVLFDIIRDESNPSASQGSSSGLLSTLLNEQTFFERASTFLQNTGDKNYCLIAIDIKDFKVFNEWYGRKAGDRYLMNLGLLLNRLQKTDDGLAGYMGEDNFCILLPFQDALLKKLQTSIASYLKNAAINTLFTPKFGLYAIEDKELQISTMYDRAIIAQEDSKKPYDGNITKFEIEMLNKIKNNYLLTSEIINGIKNNEFIFYVQPKCNMITGKIVGIESLARWIHPKRGLIYPKDFLPLLEKNGLISNLDRYIWEQTAKCIRSWIDRGIHPIPVSVNVSRSDIYAFEVVHFFEKLVEKYQIPTKYIEIEITESTYCEDNSIITKVVNDFREKGYTVLMDDFGSGYSSLNMLKDVAVDRLKLDMKFLEMNHISMNRGIGIIEAVVSMARIMGLGITAEGVENKEQVEFLLNTGCIYAQGYYFFRPMPLDDMEILLKDESKIDYEGIRPWELKRLHLKDLLNENLITEAMLNNILGGVAFYDVYDGSVKLVSANEPYYKTTCTNPVLFEKQKEQIIDNICEEDHPIMLKTFDEAFHSRLQGAEGKLRRIRGDGRIIWILFRVFFLKEQDGHRLYYGSVSDITKQKNLEAYLTSLIETDELTGLLNRKTAVEKIKKYLEAPASGQAALIMFDLDNFKLANDVFGHAFGDAMISQQANRLKLFFNSKNNIICRLGGDEFLIFCRKVSEKALEKRLDAYIKKIITVHYTNTKEIAFSVSAGYVMIPEQGDSFEELYQKADIALYAAKMAGNGEVRKYDDSMKTVRFELASKCHL
ncbi:MAG: hypothetical protein EUB_02821 [Eubacterium sp.]|uniref:bifunctional diguanylate cyclase/phosphodiesterase n=1 Tax=Eubacterium sp. TaxID=142586 RepID=UPI00303CB172